MVALAKSQEDVPFYLALKPTDNDLDQIYISVRDYNSFVKQRPGPGANRNYATNNRKYLVRAALQGLSLDIAEPLSWCSL